MSNNILVYSELTRNIPELITAAQKLGNEIAACVVGSADDAQTIIEHGASKVYLTEYNKNAPAEAYVTPLVNAAALSGANTIIVSMTPKGRAVAAQAAQILNAGCGSECKTIKAGSDGYEFSRAIYGGKATSFEQCTTELFVATIPQKLFEASQRDESSKGEVITIENTFSDYPVQVVDVVPREGDDVDITAANTVVCFGRGVAKEEDLPLINDLAEAVGGVVGCTRPISMDFHWLPQERYVGLSGKSVKPKLFIAVGVSGQIQCLAGANDSKVIVGINKDESAPVFEYSDYAIVADLYEVVPALISAIKSL